MNLKKFRVDVLVDYGRSGIGIGGGGYDNQVAVWFTCLEVHPLSVIHSIRTPRGLSLARSSS